MWKDITPHTASSDARSVKLVSSSVVYLELQWTYISSAQQCHIKRTRLRFAGCEHRRNVRIVGLSQTPLVYIQGLLHHHLYELISSTDIDLRSFMHMCTMPQCIYNAQQTVTVPDEYQTFTPAVKYSLCRFERSDGLRAYNQNIGLPIRSDM